MDGWMNGWNITHSSLYPEEDRVTERRRNRVVSPRLLLVSSLREQIIPPSLTA